MMLIHAIAIPALIAASLYGGMTYGKGQAVRAPAGPQGFGMNGGQGFGDGQFRQNGGQFRPGGGPGGRNGGGLVNGEIISADAQSITVKLRDGGSKIILLSDKTEISKFVAGEAGDLKVGENVMVMGSANADGSVTAQTVQLRPPGAGGPNGPGHEDRSETQPPTPPTP